MHRPCVDACNDKGVYAVEAFFPDSSAVTEPEIALERVINSALDALIEKCPLAYTSLYFYVGAHFTDGEHCFAYVRAKRADIVGFVLKAFHRNTRVQWQDVFTKGFLAIALVCGQESISGMAHGDVGSIDDEGYVYDMIHNAHVFHSTLTQHPFSS